LINVSNCVKAYKLDDTLHWVYSDIIGIFYLYYTNMHELPVSQNILDISLKHAKRENARKIVKIHIIIGQLSSFIDESIQFYWDIISKDTIAEGAELDFTRIPAEFNCKLCNSCFPFSDDDFSCPRCDSNQLEIVKGKEFYLDSIEIE
jgi:hydrogenase nickel incorporation protein HypA/HybF